MTKKRMVELTLEREELQQDLFNQGREKGLAGMWVTAEEASEDGCPCVGSFVVVDPILFEVVKESKGEETAVQLEKDIQKVLADAGREVARLIGRAAIGRDPKIRDAEKEEM